MLKPIQVLIVDDSPFVCRLLSAYLHSDPDVGVVGMAMTGERAIKLVEKLRPDVITLDLELPDMSGLNILQHVMHTFPTPVVMITGVSRRAAQMSLDALNAGAVDFILKYAPGQSPAPEALQREIIAKVKAAAAVKMVRSIRRRSLRRLSPLPTQAGIALPKLAESKQRSTFPVVVIGASTGGPIAIREVLAELPPTFPAAVVVVQHMPASFTGVLATQLNHRVGLQVKEAEVGDRLRAGLVLVAPGDQHLLVRPDGSVFLSQAPKIGGHRPSIDVTMQSVAQGFGARANGVVLTGMGEDGAHGLVAIRTRGGKVFVQDAASCVVDGMPQRALEKTAVDCVAPPREIAQALRQVIQAQVNGR